MVFVQDLVLRLPVANACEQASPMHEIIGQQWGMLPLFPNLRFIKIHVEVDKHLDLDDPGAPLDITSTAIRLACAFSEQAALSFVLHLPYDQDIVGNNQALLPPIFGPMIGKSIAQLDFGMFSPINAIQCDLAYQSFRLVAPKLRGLTYTTRIGWPYRKTVFRFP